MQDLVDIQTWHPLTVHFPIAFLSLSGILSIYLIFKYYKPLAQFNLGLLVLGVVLALIALYTGDIEDGKVSRYICDPTVLKTHENYAYYTVYIFSTSIIFWVILLAKAYKVLRKLVVSVILILNLAGLASLVYVGHLGASLVYEQAAGVNVPDEDCSEF